MTNHSIQQYRLFFLVAFFSIHIPAHAVADNEGKWTPAWITAQQLTEPHNLPPAPGLVGRTIRQILRPTLAGSKARVTFSNVFGDSPVTISSAHLALSDGESSIAPSSDRILLFNNNATVTLQPGTAITTDPVEIAVNPSQNLAVSLYLSAVPTNLTGHPGSRTTSFIVPGDATAEVSLNTPTRTDHWYLACTVEVLADNSASAIVIIGDSLTDGRGSITNKNNRWPDNLSRRLLADPTTAHLAVLNAGVGGGRVLRDGLGPSALARFERDVLSHAGVRYLVVFEGINDLGTAVGARAKGEPAATADDIIAGYQQMILRAHARGILVYGCTLMPFEGFTSYHTSESEADRQKINQWVRNGGAFDAVIDFDAIARDPAHPTKLRADMDGGDHLHLSADGYGILADAIDLHLFSKSDCCCAPAKTLCRRPE